MGLYDRKLSEFNEHGRRVAARTVPRLATAKPIRVQSLLFGRNSGWDASKAKAWAKSHGYRHGKVDVTDQYIRIRQFDPKNLKVKRTITLGRGIRAVVAKEEDMAARKRRAKKASAAPRRRKRARAAVAAPKRRRKRAVRETTRRSRRRSLPGGTMMEAKRKRRRKAPRRSKARRVTRESWRDDSAGHSRAAKKGHRRRKSRRKSTRAREYAYEARKPRRRRVKRRVHAVSETRRKSHRRSRRRHGMFEANRGGSSGMTSAQFAVAALSGGVGFVFADAVDRFLATYNPDPAKADLNKPVTDKFTSNGAGTLANVLNLGSTPNAIRLGASVGLTALPAIGSMFVKNPFVRSSLEGMAIGSGIKLFSLIWNNLVMGHLLAPKDQSVAGMQKSIVARLYPAEVAAAINLKQTPPLQQMVSTGGSGALSDAPQTTGVGAPDVGPFALAGSSDYPDAAQALRQQAGMSGFPTLQNVWGTGDFPTAAQAMGVGEVMDVIAKTVSSVLPSVAPAQAAQAAVQAAASPQDLAGALQRVLPHVPAHALHECARHIHPHVSRLHANLPMNLHPLSAPQPQMPATQAGVSQPPAYQPGPPPGPGPGPQAAPNKEDCGCGVADTNAFLGFIGDAQEDTLYGGDGKAA